MWITCTTTLFFKDFNPALKADVFRSCLLNISDVT